MPYNGVSFDTVNKIEANNHGKTQKIPGAFNATFEEYSQGIGEFKDGAYMIPLDVLHLLTSYHGFTMLQVRIGVYNGANQRAPEINFSDFKIGSKVLTYPLYYYYLVISINDN